MKRTNKNKALYLRNIMLNVLDKYELRKEIKKLNKTITKLQEENKELKENNDFLFDENSTLKAKLLFMEVGEK